MIAGGISFYGLGKLMILEGTLNEFGYGQALLYYQKDIQKLNQENNVNLIFEQDGAKSHTSKANLNLINDLFSEGTWLQNPPNSPDIAYPIEEIWSIIKPRIKRREPKTVEELKKFTAEEWYSIPKSIIQNLIMGYLSRINKIVELNGERLEPEDLRKLDKIKKEEHVWEKPKEIPKMKTIYNDERLKLIKKKEIGMLNKEKKRILKFYKKKIRKTNSNQKKFKKGIKKFIHREGT